MRVGIYDMYLDSLGGGEKYMLSLASCLSEKHAVDVFWDDKTILEHAQERYGLPLSTVNVVPNIFHPSVGLKKRLTSTKKYDVLFYLSDGSIPLLFAKKNILHFQFPVPWVHVTLKDKLKLKNTSHIICNSEYTKQFIDKKFHVVSDVLYPPAEMVKDGEIKKENIILSVGRYNKLLGDDDFKKLGKMIQIFKEDISSKRKDWKLVLVVSFPQKDEEHIKELENNIKGFAIDILKNIPHSKLLEQYQKAKIYWHAAGFEEDLSLHPERAEHFGITIVEAMSAGAIPIVINAGGIPEIITNGQNGYTWNTRLELVEKTLEITKNSLQSEHVAVAAIERARHFSYETFCKHATSLIT